MPSTCPRVCQVISLAHVQASNDHPVVFYCMFFHVFWRLTWLKMAKWPTTMVKELLVTCWSSWWFDWRLLIFLSIWDDRLVNQQLIIYHRGSNHQAVMYDQQNVGNIQFLPTWHCWPSNNYCWVFTMVSCGQDMYASLILPKIIGIVAGQPKNDDWTAYLMLVSP